jgi:S-adenosylmethionine:tRNA ribosyltransferase-isomerase
MRVDAFDFELPDDLVAQEPPAERGASRLMIVPRASSDPSGRSGDGDPALPAVHPVREDTSLEITAPGDIVAHRMFADLPAVLRRGDLLVVNDTRVFPARLLGRRLPGGGAVECLLLEGDAGPSEAASAEYQALVHPGQRLKPGSRMVFEQDGVSVEGEVLARHFGGRRTVRLWTTAGGSLRAAIDRIGHIPLPPYIRRDDTRDDRERYQTVYARERGSIAAPTAGLHFSTTLMSRLEESGIEVARVTLHVGYGTFKPVRAENVEEHEVDREAFSVGAGTAGQLTRARREGRRIVAVGTTTVRALESLRVARDGHVEPADSTTDLFIRPGHRFQLVDGIVTNFHLPRSSLLMLVAAFGGHARVMAAYREAVRLRYRFYSYGDAMLVL